MKELIVFYSHSNNTRKGAELIKELTGADILELKMKDPYPSDVWKTVKIFKKEMKKHDVKAIEQITIDVSSYDRIYIGTPNWGNTVAPAIITFLNEFDLSNKEIVLFVTHGGGGVGECARYMMKHSGTDKQGKPLVYSGGNISTHQVREWLDEINE